MKSYLFFLFLFSFFFIFYFYYDQINYFLPLENSFKFIFVIIGIGAIIFPHLSKNINKISNKEHLKKFMIKRYRKKI